MRPKGGTLSHWDVLKRHELTGSVSSYQALQPLESLQSPHQQELAGCLLILGPETRWKSTESPPAGRTSQEVASHSWRFPTFGTLRQINFSSLCNFWSVVFSVAKKGDQEDPRWRLWKLDQSLCCLSSPCQEFGGLEDTGYCWGSSATE